MLILVTGGLGFIGSHTVIELIRKKHKVIIVDNLVNSKLSVLDNLSKITKETIPFYEYDVTCKNIIESLFKKYRINAVIHFAGLKSVYDSISYPLDYYFNNLVSTINLVQLCVKYDVNKFIFSSSATVYGRQNSPLTEDSELLNTTNPYGETKAMAERILFDTSKANSAFTPTLLRYFNPVGAHKSGLIGDDPKGIPSNLMPYIAKVAKGEFKELNIFGGNYDTIDGTGVRDYIHVVDLAQGHVAALDNTRKGVNIYNLGTGFGISVLELVHTFEDVNKIKVPYKISERRLGDLASVYAKVSKASEELKWKTKKTVEDMVKDAWNFEKNNI